VYKYLTGVTGPEAVGTNQKTGVPHECKVKLLLVRAQVAYGGCGFSILGDIQKPSGHGLGHLALCDCLSRGLGQDDHLQRSLLTTTVF